MLVPVSIVHGLTNEQSAKVYQFLDTYDKKLDLMSDEALTAKTTRLITALSKYRISTQLSEKTDDIIRILLEYLCVKRQNITAQFCGTSIVPYKDNPGNTAKFIEDQNNIRSAYDLVRLTHNELLRQVAQDYAETLCETEYFSHTGLDGSTMVSRTQKTDYNYRALGENLAYGADNPRLTAIQFWISESHRDNMLKPQFREVGVGFCEKYWVVMFGRQKEDNTRQF